MGPASIEHARDRFLAVFPQGFEDREYLRRERNYKVRVHEKWEELLGQPRYRSFIESENYTEVARLALQADRRLNLLFPQEKAALKDALADDDGAKLFAIGLYSLLHGKGELPGRFETFAKYMDALPQPGTPLRWPAITIFPFIAQPQQHLFLKPNVTKAVANAAGRQLNYQTEPNWLTYTSLLDLGRWLGDRLADLRPRDNFDIQSFIWVTGSDSYT